ncbi:hypothetical protein HYS82_03325 [Candidatus Amesbacteria bacterium]|nr:hypothetical protein [Candidatus Amesbacteria bacterium]
MFEKVKVRAKTGVEERKKRRIPISHFLMPIVYTEVMELPKTYGESQKLRAGIARVATKKSTMPQKKVALKALSEIQEIFARSRLALEDFG